MGKTIEFYDQGIYAIRKEIVKCEFEIKQIERQIPIHEKKMAEEKATGKKAKFFDRTTPTRVKSRSHLTWYGGVKTEYYKTGGKDKYVGRKTVLKRLNGKKLELQGEIKNLKSRFENLKNKRQKLKEKLEMKGIEVLETIYDQIEEPEELSLCPYCAYPLKEDKVTCPICNTLIEI